ncbi:MAG: YbaB/EbfC family nucleoid-associated protein [Agathobaculum sp.]|jgi:DNA-binding YbaB/EbfC family protein|uniref:YbaB/EbfC family nucleoid-associated protein n=1 Tax=Agathobaculum sp. TaxID=2048138 RepID=UPI003D94ABC2
MARGGFPGGMNMQNMMRQAQQMQARMQQMQAELEEREVEATAGGGMVRVVATGKKMIKSIEIKEEVVDPDDIEMLQDLVMAAVNEALSKADEMVSAEMGKITGGMNLGGLF